LSWSIHSTRPSDEILESIGLLILSTNTENKEVLHLLVKKPEVLLERVTETPNCDLLEEPTGREETLLFSTDTDKKYRNKLPHRILFSNEIFTFLL
jgi:hypothetical protein